MIANKIGGHAFLQEETKGHGHRNSRASSNLHEAKSANEYNEEEIVQINSYFE
jgi:hypothetical protein